MSVEFEKNVLEKLDKIDKQEGLINMILEKLDKQDSFNNMILEKLDKQENFNNLILERFDNLEKDVKETKLELEKFSNYFTAFEFDINRKVDALLETYSFNDEKHMKYDKDIFNLKEQTFNHDVRIAYLEGKIAMA